MSVWPAHAARSAPTSMVLTSATADRATTSGRMGTPVKVGDALLHITNAMFIRRLWLDTFMNQFHIILLAPCRPDINECSQSIGNLCTYKCVNVPGSYQCACPEYGYTMSPNGRSCRGEWLCSDNYNWSFHSGSVITQSVKLYWPKNLVSLIRIFYLSIFVPHRA